MPRKRAKPPKKDPRKIHLGAWLSRLGYKRVEVAEKVEITESYLSEIIANKKKNPNIDILLQVSEFIGVSINALYWPPPPFQTVETMQGLSPEARQRLTGRRPS